MTSAIRVAWGLLLCAPLSVLSLDRSNSWDVVLRTNFIGDESVRADNRATVELDDTLGFGFGLIYNVSPRSSLGVDFDWANIDYDATTTPAQGNAGDAFRYRGRLDITSMHAGGTYYFTEDVVQPFVTASLGVSHYDTNIPDGPASAVCWWDPWWGYYCNVDVPTKTDTKFSYGAGLGLRWNINDAYFLRGQYSRSWLDVGGGAGTPDLEIWRLELGISL